jgi:hypothetical protein
LVNCGCDKDESGRFLLDVVSSSETDEDNDTRGELEENVDVGGGKSGLRLFDFGRSFGVSDVVGGLVDFFLMGVIGGRP